MPSRLTRQSDGAAFTPLIDTANVAKIDILNVA
jgi:hypothetical protein